MYVKLPAGPPFNTIFTKQVLDKPRNFWYNILTKENDTLKNEKGICTMAMNMNEMKATARMATIAELMEVLEKCDAVKFADNSFAILQNVEGQEIWTEVTVKSKAFKDTKVSKAFDPYTAAAEWEEEKKIAAGVKAKKAAEKAKKIAKDAEKRKEKEGE